MGSLEMEKKMVGWAARDLSGVLSPYTYTLRHEVVGEVLEVGSDVTKFRVGDMVGVVASMLWEMPAMRFRNRARLRQEDWSYNDVYTDGKANQGGFAEAMVVDQEFVIKIPDGMEPEQAAQLLGACVTIYNLLNHFALNQSGLREGILRLGGVGTWA